MAEGLSDVASILTGQPAGEDESPVSPTPDAAQETEPVPGEQAPDTPAPTDDEPPEKAEPLSVKQLAEKLEITPAQLYARLEITVGDKKMSLGEFKDRARQLHDADKALTDADAHALKSGNEVLRQNRALAIALKRLGRPLTDAELSEGETLQSEYIKEQNRLTLAAIPAWSDTAVQNDEVAQIGALLTEYGFNPVEASQVVDHRTIKIFRDFTAQSKRLKAAEKSVIAPKSVPSGKGKRKSAPDKRTATDRYKAGELSQRDAITAIISEG